MRLLAAWAGNPSEYWAQILVLVLAVAFGTVLIRKIASSKKTS